MRMNFGKRFTSLLLAVILVLSGIGWTPSPTYAATITTSDYQFDNISMYFLDVDGNRTAVDPDDPELRVNQNQLLAFDFDWSLDNLEDVDFTLDADEAHYLYTFPAQLNLGDDILTGRVFDDSFYTDPANNVPNYGLWTLDPVDKTLSIVFGPEINTLSGRVGRVGLQSQLDLSGGAIEVPFEIATPIEGQLTKSFKLYLDVTGGDDIDKTGAKKADENFQTWDVEINTELDTIATPVFTDVYDARLGYVADSLTITELIVSTDGSTTDGPTHTVITKDISGSNEQVVELPNDGDLINAIITDNPGTHTFTVTFDKAVDKAYRLHYETEIKTIDVTQSTFNYVNNAAFNGGTSNDTVTVTRGAILAKNGSINREYNATEIYWTITINQSLYNMENLVLTDTMPAGLTLDPTSVTVTELVGGGVYNAGNYVDTSTANSLDIDFSTLDVAEALVVSYTTTINPDDKDDMTNRISYANTASVTYGDASQYTVSKTSTKYIKKGRQLYKFATHSVSYNEEKYLDWVIEVNASELSSGVFVIEDTIESGQTLYKDTHTHGVYADLIQAIVVQELGVTHGGLFSGDDTSTSLSAFRARFTNVGTPLVHGSDYFFEKLPADDANELKFQIRFANAIDKPYRISYRTRITNYDDSSITNSAVFGVHSTSAGRNPGIANEYNKTSSYTHYDDQTFGWNIDIFPEQEGLANVKITDDFPTDQFMTPAQFAAISVTSTGTVAAHTITETFVGGLIKGFVIQFSEEVNNGRYDIDYETSLDPDVMATNGNLLYRNNLKIYRDTTTEVYSEVVTPALSSLADHNGRKFGSLDQNNKRLNWTIDTNYLSRNLNDVVITDNITGNQRLVSGSTVIQKYDVNSSGSIINVVTLDETTPIKLSQFVIDEDVNNNVLTVTFPSNINTASPTGHIYDIDSPYRITYKTEFEGISQTSYANTALLNYGESYSATISHPDGNKFIDKDGVRTGTSHVDWTVNINRSQSEITSFTLDDDLSAGLMLYPYGTDISAVDFSTIFTLKTNAGGDLAFNDYFTYTEDARVLVTEPLSFHLTSKLPIEDHLVLTYKTDIDVNEVLQQQVSNAVDFNGNSVSSGVTTANDSINHTFFSGTGSGSGDVGSFTMTKVDKDDATIQFEGINFEFYKENTLLGTLTTDVNGEITVNNLRYANYKLVELNVPAGYKVDGLETSFTIDSTVKKVFDIENERIRTLNIKKVDALDAGLVLEGAKFNILDAGDNIIATVTTDATGSASATIGVGTYRLVETEAPDGYIVRSTPQTVVTNNASIVFDTTVTNDLKRILRIKKADALDADQVLEGAVFEVFDSGDNLVGEVTTDASGIGSIEVDFGTFKIIEKTAPNNYLLNTVPQLVNITDASIIHDFTMSNEHVRSIRVKKVDARDANVLLSGAEFNILDDSDNVFGTVVTNVDGYGSIVVPYGDYKIVETKAPENYLLDATPTDIEVTNATVIHDVTMSNEHVRSIRVRKVDSGNNSYGLVGAEFKVYDDADQLVDTITTDVNGFASLTVPYGTYKVVESKAPAGYYLNETPQTVVVDISKVVHDLIFEDVRRVYTSDYVPPVETPPTEEPEEEEEETPEDLPIIEIIKDKTEKGEPIRGKLEIPGDKEIGDKPENGDAQANDEGDWVYIPDEEFVGEDGFSLIITNEDGEEGIVYFEFEIEETPQGAVELPQTGDSASYTLYLAGLLLISGAFLFFKLRK